jgi:ATP-binding cassette subfamily G (WHITE) protein 1
MSSLQIFNKERLVVVREQANQMYDVIPYYYARVIVETPLYLMVPLLFSAIIYFAVGF